MKSRILELAVTVILVCVSVSAVYAIEPLPPVDYQQADTSRWQCGLCPSREGWYGTLDLGPGWVGGSSLKYADYRGLDERGVFPSVDGDTHYRNASDRYIDIYAQDLGRDNRSLELRGGWRGRYQLRLSYRGIPKFRGYGAATVFSGVGSGHLGLPPDWQKSTTTPGMTALDRSLTPASLKTMRRTLQGGLSLKFAHRWTYEVDFQHETKKGSRPFGAGLFTINTSQFPAPVDFTTDHLDTGLQYSGEQAQLRLGFNGSWFDNGAGSVTWENPFSSAPSNQLLRAALAPGNEYYQFSLQGAFAARSGLHFSGRAALGRMRQDDPLLPYSINPDFSEMVLPRSTADARIDTGVVNIAGKLSARLASGLDFYGSAKFDRRDNDSPVDAYSIVITDFLPGGDRYNRPYSFEREKYDLEFRYRGPRAIGLRAGSRQENYERTLQSVLETKERFYWGEVNVNQWSLTTLSMKLERSHRHASPYRQVDESGLIENPLMRKFNYADRERTRVVMAMDLVPDQPWSLNLSWSWAEDEYTESAVGLRSSEEKNVSADFGASLSPGISFNAYVSREDISSALSGFDADKDTPWEALTDDRVTTFGLAVSGRLSKRVLVDLDWIQSTSSGSIVTYTSQPFPALRSRFGNLRGSLSFAVNRSWTWKIFAEHERLSTRDWQIDDLAPGKIANVLTLMDLSPHYSVTSVHLQASYRY